MLCHVLAAHYAGRLHSNNMAHSVQTQHNELKGDQTCAILHFLICPIALNVAQKFYFSLLILYVRSS